MFAFPVAPTFGLDHGGYGQLPEAHELYWEWVESWGEHKHDLGESRLQSLDRVKDIQSGNKIFSREVFNYRNKNTVGMK